MMLSALDLLGSVVTALLSSHAGRLDRLAVHYPRARLGVSPTPTRCGQAATLRRITQRHLAIRRSLLKPSSSNRVSGPVCR